MAEPIARALPDSTELEVAGYNVPQCSIHYEWTDPTGQDGWTIQLDIEAREPIPASYVAGVVHHTVARCADLAESLAGILSQRDDDVVHDDVNPSDDRDTLTPPSP